MVGLVFNDNASFGCELDAMSSTGRVWNASMAHLGCGLVYLIIFGRLFGNYLVINERIRIKGMGRNT
jgi:hypothetical protein